MLSRQRGDHPEAARGARRDAALLRARATARSPAASISSRPRRPQAYEAARARVARFLGAASPDEIVFVRGTTEAVNLVAASFARPRLAARRRDPGHRARAPFEPRPLADGLRGARRASRRRRRSTTAARSIRRSSRAGSGRARKLAAFAHVSNALGTVLPVAEMVRLRARRRRAGVRRRRAGGAPSRRSTSPRSAATSSPSPATRSTARPASARSRAGASCSPRCRPGRAAAA